MGALGNSRGGTLGGAERTLAFPFLLETPQPKMQFTMREMSIA